MKRESTMKKPHDEETRAVPRSYYGEILQEAREYFYAAKGARERREDALDRAHLSRYLPYILQAQEDLWEAEAREIEAAIAWQNKGIQAYQARAGGGASQEKSKTEETQLTLLFENKKPESGEAGNDHKCDSSVGGRTTTSLAGGGIQPDPLARKIHSPGTGKREAGTKRETGH